MSHDRGVSVFQFEDIGQLVARFETLISTREHLLRRQGEVERQRESDSLELRRYVSEQNSILLQYNNTLSQLQTELDNVVSHTLAQVPSLSAHTVHWGDPVPILLHRVTKPLWVELGSFKWL